MIWLMAHRARVLVVEDDTSIRHALEASLRGEGYEVRAHGDGTGVRELASTFLPDLAILDVRLPTGPDGFAIARSLRAVDDVAVLFLTAADSLGDRLAGFQAGGDDYLVKPFSMAELLARAQALLRRSGRLRSSVWQIDDMVVDDASRRVMRGGAVLDLTKTEYDLLSVLVQHRGQVLSKLQLLTQVWGFEAYATNVVEVHMSSLRRKIEAHGSRLVHTVRSVGYTLRT
jgi:two-component system OmpR family response regulator